MSVKRGDWVSTGTTVWYTSTNAVTALREFRDRNPDTRLRVEYAFGGWVVQRFALR